MSAHPKLVSAFGGEDDAFAASHSSTLAFALSELLDKDRGRAYVPHNSAAGPFATGLCKPGPGDGSQAWIEEIGSGDGAGRGDGWARFVMCPGDGSREPGSPGCKCRFGTRAGDACRNCPGVSVMCGTVSCGQYVCMYVSCMYVCTYVMNVCLCLWVYVCVCVCMYVCMYSCLFSQAKLGMDEIGFL